MKKFNAKKSLSEKGEWVEKCVLFYILLLNIFNHKMCIIKNKLFEKEWPVLITLLLSIYYFQYPEPYNPCRTITHLQSFIVR